MSSSSFTPSLAPSRVALQFKEALPLTGAQVVRTVNGAALSENVVKRLLSEGNVEYIEPNYIYRTSAVPNDPKFEDLWGLHNSGQTGGTADVDIDAPEAWDLSAGSSAVVVGIIDTGINYLHPDLASNLWRNPGELPANGIDDDNNGVVDDIHGYNAITGSGDPADDHSHGSHVAGTIGGAGHNGYGVTGVNWNLKLMGLKFLDASGSGTTEDAIKAIAYAIRMKRAGVNLRVLNNSWGGSGESRALEDAIKAANDEGILFVAAAGNDANDNDSSPMFPASYTAANVVAVAAVDDNGNLASFSNFGLNSVDVAAPGEGILSTVLGQGFESYSGTSMAAPHVSGIAALLLSREAALSVEQLRRRILTTAKPLTSLNGLISAPGIVSAYNALTNTVTPLPLPRTLTQYISMSIAPSADNDFGQKILEIDDGYAHVTLDFNFPYYKQNFTRIAISANGRILPLADGEALPNQPDYSNGVTRGISVYNDDLYPAGGGTRGVYLKRDSSAVTITWQAIPYSLRNSSDAVSEITVQARLFADGRIETYFVDTFTGNSTYDDAASASIGIAPPGNAAGTKLIVSSNSPAPEIAASGKALRYQLKVNSDYADFDGDGTSDLALYRKGRWLLSLSSTGFNPAQQALLATPQGTPFISDFDGDGRPDLAVWRNNGSYSILRSSTAYATLQTIKVGAKGDTPLVGDFNGDRRADVSVYKRSRSGGTILTLLSGIHPRGSRASAGSRLKLKAVPKDVLPLSGDFNGEGVDDYAFFSTGSALWKVFGATGRSLSANKWGKKNGTPLSCDFDGSGRADKIVVSAAGSSLEWLIMTDASVVTSVLFGQAGDKPGCRGDYDSDGNVDLTVYRPSTGQFLIRRSSDGATAIVQAGAGIVPR